MARTRGATRPWVASLAARLRAGCPPQAAVVVVELVVLHPAPARQRITGCSPIPAKLASARCRIMCLGLEARAEPGVLRLRLVPGASVLRLRQARAQQWVPELRSLQAVPPQGRHLTR